MANKRSGSNRAKREQDDFDTAYRKMTGSGRYAKKSKRRAILQRL